MGLTVVTQVTVYLIRHADTISLQMTWDCYIFFVFFIVLLNLEYNVFSIKRQTSKLHCIRIFDFSN